MVKKIEHKNKNYYICEICKFNYNSKELAQECENFCDKYKSCSVELTKKAVKLE